MSIKKWIIRSFPESMKSFLLLVTIIFTGTIVHSQNTITLSDAIRTALTNNLQLEIYRNDAEIAHNNNYPGNAGMRPNVSLLANDNPSLTNINQKFTNGTTIERDNVFSNSVGASVVGSIALYDGSKMFATKRKLESMDMAGFNMLKAQIQSTISKVITGYSNIIRHKQFLEVVIQLEELSQQRLEIIKARQTAGLANATDLYLAQMDIESKKQDVLVQQVMVSNAYTDLNVLMNLKADSTYEVESFILNATPLKKGDLDSLLKQNPELMYTQNQLEVAEETKKEMAAARLPLIRLTGAYSYNMTQSQAGFSLLNQSYGPQAGLSLNMPLFTGSVNARNYTNAKINLQSSELKLKATEQSLRGSYVQAWESYTAVLSQLASDSLSIVIAEDYIDLMQQRFKAGQNTIIELKEAQRSFEETYYRFISNQYIAKLAETQLLLLTGQLAN